MRPRHGSCDARSSERSEVIREKGSGYEKYGTFGFLGNGVTFFLTALIVVRHLWFSGGLSSFFKPAVSGTQYLLDSFSK